MKIRAMWKSTCATLALVAMAHPLAFAATPPLIPAAATGTVGAAQLRDPSQQTALTVSAKLQLLRQQVKYVFVLFQENRSFDHYFGTYPGANGIPANVELAWQPGGAPAVAPFP